MSAITKQWLQQKIADMEAARDEIPFGLDEDSSNTLAALRIALASLEAEPVAFVMADDLKDSSIISTPAYRDLGEAMERTVGDVVALYAAPPVSVTVPDDVMAAMQKVARIRLDLNDFDGDKRGILDCLGDAEEALIEVVNRRAAMLQGADGNSPVIPDGLNIRAVAALREAVRNQWLKSDDFADRVYWKSMHDIANEIVSAMLAAAPQQEAKNV
ncbi:TPA: hypothetical protein ONC52_001943 [Enterobacter asburiae]|nr:hypothetical protein [Enterobacter asburiae]HCR2223714.1 hypothetical protein [Enterobacter asburiae]